jgi:hypothetical protein
MRNSLVMALLDNLVDVRPELECVAARLRLQPEHLSLRAFLEHEGATLPEHVHTAVLSAFFGGLGDVFSAVRKLKAVHVPRIVVHPLTAWHGSVVLDLQDMGALVRRSWAIVFSTRCRSSNCCCDNPRNVPLCTILSSCSRIASGLGLWSPIDTRKLVKAYHKK